MPAFGDEMVSPNRGRLTPHAFPSYLFTQKSLALHPSSQIHAGQRSSEGVYGPRQLFQPQIDCMPWSRNGGWFKGSVL
ncbi:hypothetical protein OROHE_022259 [Orobanche hederae]